MRGADPGRGAARDREPPVVGPRHLLHRGGGAAGAETGPSAPHDAAVSTGRTGIRRFRRLPRRRSPRASARTSARSARTAQEFGGEIVRADRRRDPARALGRTSGASTRTPARASGARPTSRAPSSTARTRALRDDMLLVLAIRDGRPVAGALNFIGRDALFGRYWGCIEDHPCLHFELLLLSGHRLRDRHGPGAASRPARRANTSSPAATCRSRRIRCTGSPTRASRPRSSDYLEAERAAVDEEIEVLTSYGPFRKVMEDCRWPAKLTEDERDAGLPALYEEGWELVPRARRDPQDLPLRELRRRLRLDDARGADRRKDEPPSRSGRTSTTAWSSR